MSPVRPRLAAAAVLATAACLAPLAAAAEAPPGPPTVTVTAAATATVPNDRMQVWLRSEAEHADAAAAAAAVNTRMAGALARARSVAGVQVATSGYSTYQLTPKGQPPRWRVSQVLSLQGGDFEPLTALVSRLQADDGLLLSGMSFSVGEAARRATEDRLAAQAIKSWQARAELAAQALGFPAWRVGKVAVQTGDVPRPYPMMRATAASADAAPPVAVEAGTTDLTVTVTGEAVLESSRLQPR